MKLHTSFPNISPSILQSQLNIIHTWSTLWQLRISHPMCSISNIGPHQQNNSFQMDQNEIKEVDHVCDLVVTIDSKVELKIHINVIVSKASQRKSLIFRRVLSRNQLNLVRAFKIYVRPLLEYASTTWSPSYINEIIAIESVQRDFTKRISGCSYLRYNERLKTLKLQSLEHKPLIADFSMTYNILQDKIFVNNKFCTLQIVSWTATLSKSLYHLLKLIHIKFSSPILSYLCGILSPLEPFSLEVHFHSNII